MSEINTNNHFDIIIIGGGLAGASLACALKDTSLKIAVVEAFPLKTDLQPSYDDRTLALSYGSRCIFEGLGLWSELEPHAQPIDTIHISDRGHFGVTRLTKEQESVEALGYVLENRTVGQQLFKAMNTAKNITVFCPATLKTLEQGEQQVSVEIVSDDKSCQLTATLLVAADGSNSQVMKLLAIGSSQKSYQQMALITNVTPSKKHNNVAYERFTENGPLAFLPMQQNRYSVVWTLSPQQAEAMYALDEADFLQQLQQCFGYRLGELKKAGTRARFPLSLQAATQMIHGRVALIGNAAHNVHPVAGQGFNLALRDIAQLSECIVDSYRAGGDIGSAKLLHAYAEQRQDDVKRVYRFTDTLVKTFSNPITPVAHLRSLSLLMVDVLPNIKRQLAVQSMGLSGKLSRLNRGLPL
ncbi:MAG: 2-octaprenyl-6-methoxyphenyl hydroxylase [Gammaproteobacteria bacterium]|nr:2-octaprenyl-6-methoxyphenyl hydroxylase [Gammaproteobacteria bacterium]